MHNSRQPLRNLGDLFPAIDLLLPCLNATASLHTTSPSGMSDVEYSMLNVGRGTSYSYTPDGKLASRTWARGVTTTYTYTNGSSLASITYSDDTPTVYFSYDRLGRQISAIVDGVATNLYSYDALTQALTNEISYGRSSVSALTRTYDALGRPTGLSLGPDYAVEYGYDTYGRFSSVTSHWPLATSHYQYSYLPGTDLLAGYTAGDFTRTVSYEPYRSLITSVENKHGSTIISKYDYTNDQLGRRISRVDSGLAFANPAFDAYSYNQRSEVTGAQRYHGTDTADTSKVYGGRQFGYAYDPIGNRISASETIGGQILSKSYVANELNQYTTINNPTAAGLRGSVTNGATVTVNMQPVHSDSITADTIPWHFALGADNATGPDFPYAEIVATLNPPTTNGTALVSTQSGHLYAPPQEEELLYDDDGNLIQDGRWQYTWNGENRLIKAVELIAPTNRQPYEVNYAYDHQGRMVWKQITTAGAPPKTITYAWDDYNIIAEHTTEASTTKTTYNTWGLDLSVTLQGAGGVGGLLAVFSPLPLGEGQGEGSMAMPCYDANGNITEYLSTNGTIYAHYEYSPFGEIVIQSGALASTFTHRFSTKPWCAITGLSEYLFRKYSPSMGRWISRDQIGIRGGALLYGMCGNNALEIADYLGLAAIRWPPDSAIPLPIIAPIDFLQPAPTLYPEDPIPSPDKPSALSKWKFPKPKVDCGGLVSDCCSKTDCMLDVHERGNRCRKDGVAGCFYFCAAACVFSSGAYIPCLATCWSYCEISFLVGCSAGEAVCVALCTKCPNP